jgi:AcrR family transcriptional regulator
VTEDSELAVTGTAGSGADEAAWRQRAVARDPSDDRTRAEQRIQAYLEAAFALIDERGSTDFTIQEVIDASQQSLRGFYQYFGGKDELLLALLEETIREATEDLRAAVEHEVDPLERLRAFTVRLHEWCDPGDGPRKRGTHNRRPISEFSVQIAVNNPQRVAAVMAPIGTMLREILDTARAAGAIEVEDTRRTAALIQQTVLYSWFGNRIAKYQQMRATAEGTWEFLLRGLRG